MNETKGASLIRWCSKRRGGVNANLACRKLQPPGGLCLLSTWVRLILSSGPSLYISILVLMVNGTHILRSLGRCRELNIIETH
jgi:hypothetical protein